MADQTTAPISMSLNRKIAALLLATLVGCVITPTAGKDVCPLRGEQPLRFVDIFDGSPAESATLIPDEEGERSGNWKLGYVYDAGRSVTIRCKYADGKAIDVKLADRIDRCDYKIGTRKTLILACK
jgi:hypothetical protein